MTTARTRVLVVAAGEDDPTDRRIARLGRWLQARDEVAVELLAWQSGPAVARLAEIGPVTDAGEVNRWRPARLAARARLGPVATAGKNLRLRRLLAPLAAVDAAVVAAGALAAVDWLPRRPSPVALVAGHADLERIGPTLLDAAAAADVVVATDPATADRLTLAGVRAVARHGLLGGVTTDRAALGLVGGTAEQAAALAAQLPAGCPGLVWFVGEREGWRLWQGAAAGAVAHRVQLADPTGDLGELQRLVALVAAGDEPPHRDVVAAGDVHGLPVVTLDDDPAAAVAAALAAPRPGPAEGWTVTVADAGPALLNALGGRDGSAGVGGPRAAAAGPARGAEG